jgi:hypothetical protein
MEKQAKTFEEKVYHIIAETSNDKGGGTFLRVMSWVVDGKVTKPVIEKREYWMTEDGLRRVGKAKGITAMDFLAILRDLSAVSEYLQIPAADIQLALDEEQRKPVMAAGRKEAF